MYGLCMVQNEFHGCCHSILPGLNKVVLAMLFPLWCYENNVICCYGSFICAFQYSNKLVLVTLFVLWCRKKRVICHLFQYQSQGYICCNIAKVTLLVAVLLKQYYYSHNIDNSRCSGLKIIKSILFVSEIVKATPFCWNITEARLFCIMLLQRFAPLWCCWIKLKYIHVDVTWYKVA